MNIPIQAPGMAIEPEINNYSVKFMDLNKQKCEKIILEKKFWPHG